MLRSFMSHPLFSTLVSAIAIIIGALIGGACSWFVTKKAALRNEKLQSKITEDNKKYEEDYNLDKLRENATIIKIDICTALFGSIRGFKSVSIKEENDIYPLPINPNYSLAIASFKEKFDLKEISYIYQLYGIIEKLNHDIKNFHFTKDEFNLIEKDYLILLKKLYGDNFDKIIMLDIDSVSYESLYNNEFIKIGYKDVLKKLDMVCSGKWL